LLSFDDLVGYPLPDQSGNLRYLQTPATIWGAEAVFFVRSPVAVPKSKDKLFWIIQERKVQGIALYRLRYRWPAMNPPAPDDDVRSTPAACPWTGPSQTASASLPNCPTGTRSPPNSRNKLL
jgi:hypothetical protein